MINRSRMAAIVALASIGAHSYGHVLEIPSRRDMPPRIAGPKYKADKPKKSRALRRIKGR